MHWRAFLILGLLREVYGRESYDKDLGISKQFQKTQKLF